jgi:hypothetical protein
VTLPAGAGPIKVVLIAGWGRSGSTLLEAIVAQDDRFVALGEVRSLWQRGYLSNTLCGCGVAFTECPFWQKVDDAAFGGLDRDEARRIRALNKHALRPVSIPRLLLRRPSKRMVEYQDLLRLVFQTAVDVSGASVVLDSSKDGVYGLLLARTPGVELHVVHLVRDARAVAFSWRRKVVRPEIHWETRLQPVLPVARSGVVWLYFNLVGIALRFFARSYRFVRYEDFVDDPASVVADVRRALDMEVGGWPVLDDHHVELPVVHQVAGNPARFKGRSVELRLDDEWRHAMPRRDRWKVTAASWPLLLWYGYAPRGRVSRARARR